MATFCDNEGHVWDGVSSVLKTSVISRGTFSTYPIFNYFFFFLKIQATKESVKVEWTIRRTMLIIITGVHKDYFPENRISFLGMFLYVSPIPTMKLFAKKESVPMTSFDHQFVLFINVFNCIHCCSFLKFSPPFIPQLYSLRFLFHSVFSLSNWWFFLLIF